MSRMIKSVERRAVGAVVLACLLWGGTFVAIRDTVTAIPPATLVSARFLFAGIAIAGAGAALLSLREGFALGLGEALTLAGAALFALQIVTVARFVRQADPVALMCVNSFAAAGLLLPFAGPS